MSVSISLCTDDGDDCTVMTCTALSIHVQVVLTVVSETQEEEEEKPSEDRKRTGGEGEKELEGKGKKNWRGRGCRCQSVLQFSTRLRRDGLETENSLEGKRCVTVSQFSSWEEMAWRQRTVWRGRGVSLSVSSAAGKRWLGDRNMFGGEEVCHCQSVQQLGRDGLETETCLEGKRCVTVSQFSSWEEMAWRQKHVWRGRGVSLSVSAAAGKRWLGDRNMFGGEEVCHCQSVQQLGRDGLETETCLEGKRCVTVSQCSSWEEMAWRQKHVWRGRGVSLSVSAAARQLRRGGFWGVCKGLLRAYFSQSLLESLPLLRCRIGEGAEAKTIWADD